MKHINGIPIPKYGTNAVLRRFLIDVLKSFGGNLNQASKALNCSPATLMKVRDGLQDGSDSVRKHFSIPIHCQRVRISADLESTADVHRLHEMVREVGFESWSDFCRSIAHGEMKIYKWWNGNGDLATRRVEVVLYDD